MDLGAGGGGGAGRAGLVLVGVGAGLWFRSLGSTTNASGELSQPGVCAGEGVEEAEGADRSADLGEAGWEFGEGEVVFWGGLEEVEEGRGVGAVEDDLQEGLEGAEEAFYAVC